MVTRQTCIYYYYQSRNRKIFDRQEIIYFNYTLAYYLLSEDKKPNPDAGRLGLALGSIFHQLENSKNFWYNIYTKAKER